MRNARHRVVCAVAGIVMLSLTGASAEAQTVKQTTAPRIQSVQGVDSYKTYCAACHGPQAKGDGPAATALKKAPSDLTTIAKRNGGKFSTTDVEAVIMGQEEMASHGSRDMPIWGPVFRSLAPDSSFRKLRVTNLIDYLKTIQTQ